MISENCYNRLYLKLRITTHNIKNNINYILYKSIIVVAIKRDWNRTLMTGNNIERYRSRSNEKNVHSDNFSINRVYIYIYIIIL